MIARVNGLHLVHMVENGTTLCGHEARETWPASDNTATCSKCHTRPLLKRGDIDGAVKMVLSLAPSSDKQVELNRVSALSEVVAARLNVA